MKSKMKIVKLVRLNGELYRQEELNQEELHRMLVGRVKEVMEGLGYEKIEPA